MTNPDTRIEHEHLNGGRRGLSLNKSLLIPLGVFLVLVVFLIMGFQLKDARLLPSALVDKPFPDFSLRDLQQPKLMRTKADLGGQISLVNVWATWCPNCIIEHPELTRIVREEGLALIGVNYNDDNTKARNWLERRGDPYQFHVVDNEGTLAIDLGVYGAPETFIVDEQGLIRFRFVGPVSRQVWDEQLSAVVDQLKNEKLKSDS